MAALVDQRDGTDHHHHRNLRYKCHSDRSG
jgi:hypothetical protein